MTLDEQIAVLKALKEGKKIEARLNTGDPSEQWKSWVSSPNFVRFDYRIVPEPRRFIVFMWEGQMYARPYGSYIPDAATILCTATEDLNLGEAVAPMLDALKQTLRSDEQVKADAQLKLNKL